MLKNTMEPEGADNMAPARGILDKEAYTRASTRPSSCTHTHGRTQAYACPQQPACGHGHTRTDLHVILIAVNVNNGFVNTPQCYVTRTLPYCLFCKCLLFMSSVLIQDVLQSLFGDNTHFTAKQHFIHNQPPGKSVNEELQKVLKFRSAMCNAHFTSHKQWFTNKAVLTWHANILSVKWLVGHPVFITASEWDYYRFEKHFRLETGHQYIPIQTRNILSQSANPKHTA
jgi:hypothetical protein